MTAFIQVIIPGIDVDYVVEVPNMINDYFINGTEIYMQKKWEKFFLKISHFI